MQLWRKKTLYVVKRKLIVTNFNIDDIPTSDLLQESERGLPDGIYMEKSDCKLIATLIRQASILSELLPGCRLEYGEIRGPKDGIIDWPKTQRDHYSLNHGLFILSCPQTH